VYRNRYWNDTVFTALDALQTLTRTTGIPPAELALRWAINRPAVNAVLIGGSRPENIRSHLAAIGKGPLPTELTDAVTAISASVPGPMPLYNR
jgi:aryl-alcohol dehydrogenase-like predicted oxidoreductase